MSYWFRRRERYHRPASNVCPSRWMVSPPKHVLRGWPTCYDGGTDTSAGRTPLGWRYTCLLGGRTTTAVLIHTSAGRTPLGWRYTYTCLLVGHTCYDGDTSAGRTTPLGWRYTYTCLLVGHTCYDGDTSAGRTTPLGTLRILSISMGRTSLRRRYTYTSYLGGRLVWTYISCWAVIPFTADLPAWSDNTLVACVTCTVLYGEPSQASKAT